MNGCAFPSLKLTGFKDVSLWLNFMETTRCVPKQRTLVVAFWPRLIRNLKLYLEGGGGSILTRITRSSIRVKVELKIVHESSLISSKQFMVDNGLFLSTGIDIHRTRDSFALIFFSVDMNKRPGATSEAGLQQADYN